MTILAVRGGGKNLVIDRNFIVKKQKFGIQIKKSFSDRLGNKITLEN